MAALTGPDAAWRMAFVAGGVGGFAAGVGWTGWTAWVIVLAGFGAGAAAGFGAEAGGG